MKVIKISHFIILMKRFADIRATTILLNNDIPLEIVSKWLGHNSLKTTQIYGKITNKKLSDIGKRLDEKL